MKTRGKHRPSALTHRVPRSYASKMGKKVVQIDDRDRLPVPAIDPEDHALLWHVVSAAPRQERRAALWLASSAASASSASAVYAPMQVRWTHHAREKKAVERALFPGYVFIALPAGEAIPGDREERRRNGVMHIDYLGKPASRALAGFLASVATKQLAGDYDERGTSKRKPETGPSFDIGAMVRIRGVFESFLSEVLSVSGRKAKVAVRAEGRQIVVDAPLEELEAV